MFKVKMLQSFVMALLITFPAKADFWVVVKLAEIAILDESENVFFKLKPNVFSGSTFFLDCGSVYDTDPDISDGTFSVKVRTDIGYFLLKFMTPQNYIIRRILGEL